MKLISNESQKEIMSTAELSNLTGLDEKKVVNDVRSMISELESHGVTCHYNQKLSGNGVVVGYYIDRELTETLITGYSVILRHRVIRRLHELESLVKKQAEVISHMVSIDELKEERMKNGYLQAQNAHLSQRIVAEQRITEIVLSDKKIDKKIDELACEARQCWSSRSDEMELRFKYETQCFALKEKSDALTGLIENKLGIDIKKLISKSK